MANLPPPGTPVAAYARYSSDLQNESSIEYQWSNIDKLCARFGWVIVNRYEDQAKSGTSLNGRFGLLDLIHAAGCGEFQVVVVDAQDRLSRSQADTHALLDQFKGMDVQVASARTGGIIDAMQATFAGYQASVEIENLKDRVRSGQQQAVRSGRVSGSVSYGYRVLRTEKQARGLREINPITAAVVVRIFAEYLAGMSPAAICAGLNRDGIPSPRGGDLDKRDGKKRDWKPGVLIGSADYHSGILRNTMYRGEFTWGRTQRRRSGPKVVMKPGDLSGQVTRDMPELRIISDNDFYAAQELLAAHSTRIKDGVQLPTQHRRRAVYLLSGLTECGVCGSQCVVTSARLMCTGRNLSGNGCTNTRRTPRQDVERAVLQGMEQHLLNPALLRPFGAAYQDELNKLHEHRQQVGQANVVALAVARQRRANLTNTLGLAADSPHATRALMEELEKVGADIQRLERAERAFKSEPAAPMDIDTIVAKLKAMLPDLSETLDSDHPEAVRAREIMRLMITRVVLTPIPVAREDGRGAGPVTATVEGELTQVLQLADVQVGRVSLSGSLQRTWQA
ncbi:MAG: recombinase family protein, partial [Caulobacteraceae bacterium]